MISIPYTYVAISFILLCGFFKIGQIDEEIGWVISLAVGILVLILNHYWPGGYGGLALHAVGGFVLLTIYKIVRGLTERRGPEE
ncbi:MAG: hypothetical protein JSW27_05195 [Phycisphaerales bacterium]|nr:MAG: hypothetical protein JSW27_05195 [Phycisphaerales bacterium]